MSLIFESSVEQFVIELLQNQGFIYLSPEAQEQERSDLTEVILKDRLERAIDALNPTFPPDAKNQALRQILSLPTPNLLDNNEIFHRMLTDGIDIEIMTPEGIRGDKVRLIDFDHPDHNEFVVCNQYTVLPATQGSEIKGKRPDVVLFVNGLPLVVLELKNPADEHATVHKAFTQLQNYKNAVPQLFYYNAALVASDGLDARAGTLSSDFSRFLAWKTVDGIKEDAKTTPQIETLIKGMLNKQVLLDLIRHFIVFEKSKKEDMATGLSSIISVKKIATYHQYFAVNKAVISTLRASQPRPSGTVTLHQQPEHYGLPSVKHQPPGDRKAGVIWHTQGSGKSLSMVFYAGKIVQALRNPTIVVITDRNDLDEQLFDTFAASKQLLRQEPVQAESREHLKQLLKVAGGGIIFTTIQKFFPETGSNEFELLSQRSNIIVIADEAHRSQYGFGAKTREKNGEIVIQYGFAKYLRDALPEASFIGFTGTPIEKEDASTPAVFGNYIDVYDIAQAVEDGATVPIYYESRLAKVHLKAEEAAKIDEEVAGIIEGEETSLAEQAKARWAQLEAIVGHGDRLQVIAADIIDHFEKRREVFEGKGMIVCMSRRIAVALYEEIIKLRPDWHHTDLRKGAMKVVMTSSSSDPENWQIHSTTKHDRKMIGDRFKDEHDPLKLVIVRDMWLTGFDAPCLHTMYVDKPMRGHNLMQAIARVNRVFLDKPGGLVVDYIGIASDLKTALATYTASGGQGTPALDQEQAVATLLEKLEVVEQMFQGFDYECYFPADTRHKLTIILEAQEHILGLEDGNNRYIKQVALLSQAFALSVPHPKALEKKEEVGFFQAVKARLTKFETEGMGKSDMEIETAIRQIVDKAIVAEGVVDIFDAAGIKKPDISILSDEFLEEIRHMERKNIALELLKKLLNDEVRTKMRKNFMVSRKLSEMLESTIKKYQNNLLTTAQVIEELIRLAKDLRESNKRGDDLHLNEDELAFYDALADNESARQVLGNKQLAVIAMEVFKSIKGNATIDWTLKENVRARLRRDVKRILNRYGYPPDEQLIATENILKQAELMADEWNL